MFLRHRPRHFQPPASKIFIAFQLINVKKSSAHSELSVGWLNFGAPAIVIRHHLLKIRIFMEHRQNIVFIHKKKIKVKIKSHPPASFSEKSA